MTENVIYQQIKIHKPRNFTKTTAVAKWLILLLYVQDFPGPTSDHRMRFCVLYLSPSRKMMPQYFKLFCDCFVPYDL
jgi:hypothetical protein